MAVVESYAGLFEQSKSMTPSPIRVSIQQPALPQYRIPFFQGLARVTDLSVRVHYGSERFIPYAAPNGFPGEFAPAMSCTLFGQQILWHRAQLTLATRARTDVLILSWNSRCASLVPALLKARLCGVPTILWGHGYSKKEGGTRRYIRAAIGSLAT